MMRCPVQSVRLHVTHTCHLYICMSSRNTFLYAMLYFVCNSHWMYISTSACLYRALCHYTWPVTSRYLSGGTFLNSDTVEHFIIDSLSSFILYINHRCHQHSSCHSWEPLILFNLILLSMFSLFKTPGFDLYRVLPLGPIRQQYLHHTLAGFLQCPVVFTFVNIILLYCPCGL